MAASSNTVGTEITARTSRAGGGGGQCRAIPTALPQPNPPPPPERRGHTPPPPSAPSSNRRRATCRPSPSAPLAASCPAGALCSWAAARRRGSTWVCGGGCRLGPKTAARATDSANACSHECGGGVRRRATGCEGLRGKRGGGGGGGLMHLAGVSLRGGGGKKRVCNANRHVHRDALCFMASGLSLPLLQRLTVCGWRLVAVGGWRLAADVCSGLFLPGWLGLRTSGLYWVRRASWSRVTPLPGANQPAPRSPQLRLCNDHGEGPQIHPKFAQRPHRARTPRQAFAYQREGGGVISETHPPQDLENFSSGKK